MRARRLAALIALSVLLITALTSPRGAEAAVHLQTETPPPDIQALLERMTPEERVGQLFLVTFTGNEVTPESPIYDLIVNYHIGGVVLLASNDNFVAAPQTVSEAYRLIHDLQQAEWEGSFLAVDEAVAGPERRRTYIPLFIGISQEGDGYPYDQLLSGVTPLPSAMAIGATWQPDLARQAGETLGAELAALGFNLYLGPSLDVLETPRPTSPGDPGTRVFGGDPYWVAEMGRAFIEGLHAGSENRLLVIGKHFPGGGGADRPLDEEAATVRKSLEQLKQIELAPFFAVTAATPADPTAVDGLLVSHIRYQGFQGNIRATTRPVSFDAQALSLILSLPQFVDWRAAGGLMVSDDLGSQAVRRFYDPAEQNFSARLVARDAFVAGNDLLYMGNVVSTGAPDTYATIVDTLTFFAQKYREDPAFAQNVDAAVIRILSAKQRLYGKPFSLAAVQLGADRLDTIGQGTQVTFDIARNAATLISPEARDLDTVLPSPPSPNDYLLFITDAQTAQQCSDCPPQPLMPVDAFQNAVLRLYGPDAGGQVYPNHLASHSLETLQNLLAGETGLETVRILEDDLRRADWVIISLLGVNEGQTEILRRFLSERQNILRSKHILLFSFGAPYYLDATDISKLTAYYSLYSKAPPFVEVAARLLYQELTPPGAPPVSIQAIGYDLITATSPDPGQVIQLSLDLPPLPTPTVTTPSATPAPTPTITLHTGETVSVRTGVILDHNQHPVPDGTIVRFTLNVVSETGGIIQQVESETRQGVARATFRLEQPGLLEIRAQSEPALLSEILRLDVSEEGNTAVSIITPLPNEAPSPTPEPPSPTEEVEENPPLTTEGRPRVGGWLIALMLWTGGSVLAYQAGRHYARSRRWGVRWGLCVALGGLLAYDYLALGMPGSAAWVEANGVYAIVVTTLVGEILGWGAGWLWSRSLSAPK